MNLCERTTAVGESLAKGLEKGSDFLMNGFCCERVGEEVFSTKHVIQRFMITRRKVGERFAKMWRKQWLQIRNDSPLLILFLDVSSRNSAKGLAKEVVG